MDNLERIVTQGAGGNLSTQANNELTFDPNDQISKYLEQMRHNRDKDAMEIIAGIEKRELSREP